MKTSKNIFVNPKFIGLLVVIIGIILSTLSIDYSNVSASVTGLTMILWGGILLYISPKKMIPLELNKSLIDDMYEGLNALLEKNEFNSPITYSTGKSLNELNDVSLVLHKPGFKETIQYTPPGFNLHKYLEKESNMNFSTSDVEYIFSKNIPSILNELGMASNIEYQKNSREKIKITMTNNVYTMNVMTKNKYLEMIGDPLTSAVACILARTLGENIGIEKISYNNTTTEVIFTVFREDEDL